MDSTEIVTVIVLFFQICREENSTWQAREGAVMGFNAIIRRFQWVGFNQDLVEHDSANTEYFLKVPLMMCNVEMLSRFMSRQHFTSFLIISLEKKNFRRYQSLLALS